MTVLASHLLRIELTVSDLARAERFYADALGFDVAARGVADGDYTRLLGAEQIDEVLLRRGEQIVVLQSFRPRGIDYPRDATACDPIFQHFAMPTPDIETAFARLRPFAPTLISLDGPQVLPARSGGATACKFRDPDGHPLELIQFPDRSGGGIDHSAIVVRDADRSVDFYRDRLGLRVTARQVNSGQEQDRLDGLDGATAEVIALMMPTSSPHIELLAYRPAAASPARTLRPCDVAATRLVLACAGLVSGRITIMFDPDGHALVLAPLS